MDTQDDDLLPQDPAPGYLDPMLGGLEPPLPPGSWERLQARKRRRRRVAAWWWPAGLALLLALGGGAAWLGLDAGKVGDDKALATHTPAQGEHGQKAAPMAPSAGSVKSGTKTDESGYDIKQDKADAPIVEHVSASTSAAQSGSDNLVEDGDPITQQEAAPNEVETYEAVPAKSSQRAGTIAQAITAHPTPVHHQAKESGPGRAPKRAAQRRPRQHEVASSLAPSSSNKKNTVIADHSVTQPDADQITSDATPSPSTKGRREDSRLPKQASPAASPQVTNAEAPQPSAPVQTAGTVAPLDVQADTSAKKVAQIPVVLPPVPDSAKKDSADKKRPDLGGIAWKFSLMQQFAQPGGKVQAPTLEGVRLGQAATRLSASNGFYLELGPFIPVSRVLRVQPMIGVAALWQRAELAALAGDQASVHLVQQPDGSITGTPVAPAQPTIATRTLALPQAGVQVHLLLGSRLSLQAGGQYVQAYILGHKGPAGERPRTGGPQLRAGLAYRLTTWLELQAGAQWLTLSRGAVPGVAHSRGSLPSGGLGVRVRFK